VLKIIINDNKFKLQQHFSISNRKFLSAVLIKLLPYVSFRKYI